MAHPVISVRQIKAARALVGWSQEDMAKRSAVSYPTIARLESSDGELGGRKDTVGKIVAALEAAGVIFIAENGGGVKLRKTDK
jgi:predicted transcriptional regulator